MTELPEALHSRIKALCSEGDELAKRHAYKEAVAVYAKAWELVPEPVTEWEASTWILVAIGDSCFLGGFYDSGLEAFEYALRCPGGLGNPFVHLRLGQCALENEKSELAAEHLARTYMLEGADVFASDNGKYFEFLKTRIKPPATGIW